MAIIGKIDSEADRRLSEHILILLRGLKLSRDLELAESAIRAERELTDRLANAPAKSKREMQPA
jgi:hypothetical protein